MRTPTPPRARNPEFSNDARWKEPAAIAPVTVAPPEARPSTAPSASDAEGAARRLPLDPAPTPSPRTDSNESPAPRPARILVADDERRIRLAIRSCLEAEGYTVYEAADGTEALSVILRHAPDLMILDLAMPNLDGMRTLRELQALHGQLKPRVVMLTAFGSMPAAASAIGLGAAAFVEKPLIPEALRQLVARVLAEPIDADKDLGVPIDWPADQK